MNNEQTSTREPTEADEALGSAIGSAISAHVNAPVATPPVSLIAKRAEAQARARVVQRTVVGIAVSITLLAGGLVAYNAFSDDVSTDIVATEPSVTTATTPVDSTPDSSTKTPAPTEINVAAPVFTERDPAELFGTDTYVEGVQTIGDGRVVAVTYGEAHTNLIITDNGEDWTQIYLPDDASPDIIDLSGHRWLITTLDWEGTPRSHFSDDEGTSWSEVDLSAAEGQSPTLIKTLVSGEKLLFIFKGAIDYEGQSREVLALIEEQGLVPAGTAVGGWEIQGTTLCFIPDTPDAPTFDLCGDQDPAATTTPYKFELSDQDLEAIDRYRTPGDQIQIFVSDGGPAVLVATYESWHTTADSDSEGFYIAMTTPTDELLIKSTDGFDWTETSIDSLSLDAGLLMTFRTDDWFVRSSDQGLTVQSLAELTNETPDSIIIPAATNLVSLETGPSAMAATVYGFADGAADPTEEVQLIGWSHDGRSWNLRSPSEAFGIGYDEVSVTLAVGDGYVLAHVTGFEPTATDEGLVAQPPKWFKATLQ
ncbi:MAG: hypothetical protein F4Y27_15040 [Acidimicrobiaceae bacterium]|nr:hypothetical protein [Acidimicrobiaceae bacterium]MYG55092.1 hypothetical protein [Acidimicrobiaceae bacterium]MYK00088.1 hypothetical protein [Acidimicrobiaceae bacterium]